MSSSFVSNHFELVSVFALHEPKLANEMDTVLFHAFQLLVQLSFKVCHLIFVEDCVRVVRAGQDLGGNRPAIPQTAYYGIAGSLQNEWQHVCRTVSGVGAYLDPLEAALSSFLSTLLDTPLDDDGKLQTLLGHKVKQARIGIPNLTAFTARA